MRYIICIWVLLLSGCLTGRPQFLKQFGIDCTVLNATTGRPIAGAKVYLEYEAPNPGEKNIVYGPFVTNSEGKCRVDVAGRTIWISGSDAFIGGYLVHMKVQASGYEDGGLSHDDTEALSTHELTFRLRPEQAYQALLPIRMSVATRACARLAPDTLLVDL
jgi:5-hydroxyisourate hydrolase-like protein (transthyretin family)